MADAEAQLRNLLFGPNNSDDDESDSALAVDPLVLRRSERPDHFYAGKRKRPASDDDDDDDDDDEDDEDDDDDDGDASMSDAVGSSSADAVSSRRRVRDLQGVGGPAPAAQKRARVAGDAEEAEEAEEDEIKFADIHEVQRKLFRRYQGQMVTADDDDDDDGGEPWCFLCHYRPDRQLDRTTRQNFENLVSSLVNRFPLVEEHKLALNVQAQYNMYFRQFTGRSWSVASILEHVKRHEIVPKVSRTEEYHVLDTCAHILCRNGMVIEEPNGEFGLNFAAVNLYMKLSTQREKIRARMDRDAAQEGKR